MLQVAALTGVTPHGPQPGVTPRTPLFGTKSLELSNFDYITWKNNYFLVCISYSKKFHTCMEFLKNLQNECFSQFLNGWFEKLKIHKLCWGLKFSTVSPNLVVISWICCSLLTKKGLWFFLWMHTNMQRQGVIPSKKSWGWLFTRILSLNILVFLNWIVLDCYSLLVLSFVCILKVKMIP